MQTSHKSAGDGEAPGSVSQTGNVASLPGGASASDRFTYVPGTTLGRSGYIACPADRLGERIEHLDALLCFIDQQPGQDDAASDFERLNVVIQRTLLRLASSLASEIHELHSEVSLADARTSAGARQ